jgi:betaine-aldehyde dehydrogenase
MTSDQSLQNLAGILPAWQPFINGQFEAGVSDRRLVDPATGETLCQVSECGPGQVAKAITAARQAFDRGPWSRLGADRRARFLHQLADRVETMADPLAMAETLNQGKPVRESRWDVADAAACIRFYAELAARGQDRDPAGAGATVVREPIGVCGQIAAWNFPLLLAVWKLAPALAAGNTCVLKPSEFTPLTALMLARAMQDLDLPPGVVNIVPGDGATAGQALAGSPWVDKVSFTGSAATGRAVTRAALGNLKKVALELGGKSPVIVFADQDLETVVDYALYAAYCNAGQVCSAGTRFIVQDPVHGEFVRRLAERARRIVVGPGADPGTEMGPLIHGRHLDRVQGYIRAGLAEGARLEAGGGPLRGGRFGSGFYLEPTLFSGAEPGMRIVQEEIFGPVAVVQRFATEAEAVDLANGTRYGLAGAVFTRDAERAVRVARALRAGVVWVNGYHDSGPERPWGGFKESGWGRELGTFGLDAYCEIKQLNVALEPAPIHWFKA